MMLLYDASLEKQNVWKRITKKQIMKEKIKQNNARRKKKDRTQKLTTKQP